MLPSVLITGASSMIGRAVNRVFAENGIPTLAPTHEECDLMKWDEVNLLFKWFKPTHVVNCAGWNGGLPLNLSHPATIYFRTTQINLNVLRACAEYQVEKVVSPLSSCAYPDSGDTMDESQLWNGLTNPTVECHGLAKRNTHAFSRQINKQFKTKAVCCVANNSYGPHDSFDVNKTKVVGALIKKFVDAVERGTTVTCFGTGSPRRDLIYCDDVARGIVLTLEKWDSSEVINIGSEVDYSIKEVAEKIAEITGYTKEIEWDTTKPDGQAKKMMSVTKIKELGFAPQVSLDEGLRKTIEWYKANKESLKQFSVPAREYL